MLSRLSLCLVSVALCILSSVSLISAASPSQVTAGPPQILSPLPSKASLPPIGLVVIQGAQINASQYIATATAIQEASNYAVHVAIPQFLLSLPIPVGLIFNSPVDEAVQALYADGLPQSAPLFFMGHSLGGASLQDYVFSHATTMPTMAGQILTGSALLRKYENDSLSAYPVHTLTLNGELDGLFRAARTAEAYYHRILHPRYTTSVPVSSRFPVVIVPGMTHLQIADDSVTPFLVKQMDLQPEITFDEAHAAIGSAVAAFIDVTVSQNADSADLLATLVSKSADLLQPLIDALELEGFYHFKRPCNSDTPEAQCPFYPNWPQYSKNRVPGTDTECQCGCPWTEQVSMPFMANVPSQYSVYTVDAFHDVRDINPFHHPHNWNNCSTATGSCTLNLTTVSEAVYDTLDDYDTGFTHVSALEIKTKMRSRQVITRSTTNTTETVDVDYDGYLCGEINQLSIDWAIKNAPPATLQRYQTVGQRMVIGNDNTPALPVGPLWIDGLMTYTDVTLPSGEKVNQVASTRFITDIDGWVSVIPDASGYHYCKILSPARVMEWIYTDSLRMNRHL